MDTGLRRGRAHSLAGTIIGRVDAQPAITIAEIRKRLEAQGDAPGRGTVWPLLARNGYTARKTTVFASEQNRDDVVIKRREWRKNLLSLSAFRLISIDEFSVNTKMARTRGRALRGWRCGAHIPVCHRETFAVVAALAKDGIIDPMAFDGAMTGERFRIRMDALAKSLRPGELATSDNLAAHRVSVIREVLRKKKARTSAFRRHTARNSTPSKKPSHGSNPTSGRLEQEQWMICMQLSRRQQTG